MSKSTSKSGKSLQKESETPDPPVTLVSLYDIDDFSAHHCGYCNQDGNISIGMSSEIMKIEDYQTLIDRGWRRSGTYLYKPTMEKTCCPLYTIRSDTSKFELRKSQKNTLKIVKKYLEKNERNKVFESGKNKSDEPVTKKEKQENQNNNLMKITPNNRALNKLKQNVTLTNARKVIDFFLDKKSNQSKKGDDDLADVKIQEPGKLLNVPKLKSKHKRLFRKLAKLKEKNLLNSLTDIEKHLKRSLSKSDDQSSLEKYLKVNDTPRNKLEIKLIRSWPTNKEFEESLSEEHKLYTKYQTNIHRDSPLECSLNQFKRFLCTSPLLRTSYSGPLNNTSASTSSTTNKLIDSSIAGNIGSLGYGSFHQQYRLNGKLVAVGVIDILNNCVSSVYLFYDPDYQFLNLGTYSALREIAFTRQINKLDPNIKWYYLGFYAHSCLKMRYKGLFYPSYLLCPEVFSWHPIEYCVELIEKSKYTRFATMAEIDPDKNEKIDDVKIRIKFKDESEIKIFKFREFCDFLNPSFVPQFTHLVTGYCKLFGNKFSRNVLIKF